MEGVEQQPTEACSPTICYTMSFFSPRSAPPEIQKSNKPKLIQVEPGGPINGQISLNYGSSLYLKIRCAESCQVTHVC